MKKFKLGRMRHSPHSSLSCTRQPKVESCSKLSLIINYLKILKTRITASQLYVSANLSSFNTCLIFVPDEINEITSRMGHRRGHSDLHL